MPPYRLNKGSGQAVVALSGKDIYFGVHETEESHAEYKSVIYTSGGKVGGEPNTMRDAAKPLVKLYGPTVITSAQEPRWLGGSEKSRA